MSVAAGLMVSRVRFERRVTVSDGYGNSQGRWDAIFVAWVGFRATPGREALEAGRLESTITGILSIRRSAQSVTLIAADRGVFVIGPYAGRVFNVRSIVPSHDNSTLELTIEEGAAT